MGEEVAFSPTGPSTDQLEPPMLFIPSDAGREGRGEPLQQATGCCFVPLSCCRLPCLLCRPLLNAYSLVLVASWEKEHCTHLTGNNYHPVSLISSSYVPSIQHVPPPHQMFSETGRPNVPGAKLILWLLQDS